MHVNSYNCTPFCQKNVLQWVRQHLSLWDASHEQIARMDGLIKKLIEPARSEEDLPASAVTEVPLSEIVQTCVQTFIPLAESKNKV